MRQTSDFKRLIPAVEKTESIRESLFVLKLRLSSLHKCDVAYEYMVKDNSYMRGDLVSMTTLSRNFSDLYFPGGGPNSDPVLKQVDAHARPFKVSLAKLRSENDPNFAGNKFYSALYESGCEYFAAYPFNDDVGIGFGVFTVFATKAQLDSGYSEDYFQNIALRFHKIMKSHDQLASHFNLLDQERHSLARMADGKTAADIAQELGLTVRSIELRLQSARKKLQARTTTEAVYKAVAYSILPY